MKNMNEVRRDAPSQMAPPAVVSTSQIEHRKSDIITAYIRPTTGHTSLHGSWLSNQDPPATPPRLLSAV